MSHTAESNNGVPIPEAFMNSLTHSSKHLPKVLHNSAGFEPRELKCIGITSKAFYGYNPIRWLFRRPRYWIREYTFDTGSKLVVGYKR